MHKSLSRAFLKRSGRFILESCGLFFLFSPIVREMESPWAAAPYTTTLSGFFAYSPLRVFVPYARSRGALLVSPPPRALRRPFFPHA